MQDNDDLRREPATRVSRRDFLTLCSGTALTLGLAPGALAQFAGNVAQPAGAQRANYCRFTQLVLNDCGAFRGRSEFRFTPGLNVITGPNGSGKTTIARALAGMGPWPEPGQCPAFNRASPLIRVETEGDPALLARYRDLVFIDQPERLTLVRARELLDGRQQASLADAATELFLQLVPHRASLLRGRGLEEAGRLHLLGGMDDHALAGYSFLFAARRLSGSDLPLVLDNPYSMLDNQHREYLSAFLRGQPGQLILLAPEWALHDPVQERPSWRLQAYGDHTRVTRLGA